MTFQIINLRMYHYQIQLFRLLDMVIMVIKEDYSYCICICTKTTLFIYLFIATIYNTNLLVLIFGYVNEYTPNDKVNILKIDDPYNPTWVDVTNGSNNKLNNAQLIAIITVSIALPVVINTNNNNNHN